MLITQHRFVSTLNIMYLLSSHFISSLMVVETLDKIHLYKLHFISNHQGALCLTLLYTIAYTFSLSLCPNTMF